MLVIRAKTQHSKCNQCVRYKLLIAKLHDNPMAKKEQLERFRVHLARQYEDRVAYWNLRGLSRLRQLSDSRQVVCVAIDTVDHSKFVLPKSLAMQAKDFSQFLKPSLTVTAALIHGVACIIHIAEPHICKDSSYTTEIVAHTCKIISETEGIYMPQVCVHFCGDNSSRELKNNSVCRLLSGLVSAGRVRVATLQTLESGHSHEDIDQMFSSLAAWVMGQNELHTTSDFDSSISQWLALPTTRPTEPRKLVNRIHQVRDWTIGLKKYIYIYIYIFFKKTPLQ